MEKVQNSQQSINDQKVRKIVYRCFSCRKQRENTDLIFCNDCSEKLEKERGKISISVVTNGGLVGKGLSRDDLKDYGKKNNKTVVEGKDGYVRIMEKKEK